MPVFLALIHAFGLRGFWPSPSVQSGAFALAIGLSVLMTGWLFYKWLINARKGDENEQKLSQGMSIPAILAAPFVFFLFNHIALSHTVPHLLTMVIGQPETISIDVFRETGGGRYSCEHQITIEGLNDWLFELCLTESMWDRLPSEAFNAEFAVHASSLGVAFEDFQTPEANVAGEFAVLNRWR